MGTWIREILREAGVGLSDADLEKLTDAQVVELVRRLVELAVRQPLGAIARDL